MLLLVQVQFFGSGRYDLEILFKCGRRVETKSQKVLGSNPYVCSSYRGKNRGGEGKYRDCKKRISLIIALTHFRPMFHLCRNQVVGFYKQNV